MYDVLSLEVIATILILKFLFIASSQNGPLVIRIYRSSAVYRPGALTEFSKFFGGALNRAGALIKTYEKLDLPFPAHTRTLFIIYN